MLAKRIDLNFFDPAIKILKPNAAKNIRPNAMDIGVKESEAILILKKALPQIAARAISKRKSLREALCINQG